MYKIIIRTLSSALALLLVTPAYALRLDQVGHLHGLAFAAERPGHLLLASHQGLYAAAPDGTVERLGSGSDDLMALAAVPGAPETLYASGHPPGGGNLGLLRSTDGGRNWSRWSAGHAGPADYHALAIRPDDPGILYGVSGGLQVSRDAGRTWAPVATAPDKMLALALAPGADGPLYAATERGLLSSRDGGGSWRAETLRREPASLVHATRDGTVYAFVLGQGLLVSDGREPGWKPRYNGFGSHFPLRMAVADDDPRHLALLSHASGVFTSRDGGQSWQRYGLVQPATGGAAPRGAQLYGDYCQACHGYQGVGQAAGALGAPAERDQLAPSLDGSMHAWHHSDAQLAETIREGSIARGGRMPPWKGVLSAADVTALVAYIKSLWGARELACQGAKHMNCDWTPGS